MLFCKGVLQNFTKFTRKHLYQSFLSILIKLQTKGLQLYWKTLVPVFSCEFCRTLRMATSVISWNRMLKTLSKFYSCYKYWLWVWKNCLEARNFHKWVLVGVLSSTAESWIWRCTKIGCSKNFSAPWKHLWWSLFSQVESFLFENHFKVDSFTDIFQESY